MASTSSRGAWVVAACCLASLGEGIDLQAPGVTMPVLAPLFHLTTGQGFFGGFIGTKGLFASMSTFGLFFGAMIGGRLSDLIGRKWVLVWSVALFGVFSALTVQSTDANMLLWMRFLTGLGLGGCYANMIACEPETVRPTRPATISDSGIWAGAAARMTRARMPEPNTPMMLAERIAARSISMPAMMAPGTEPML